MTANRLPRLTGRVAASALVLALCASPVWAQKAVMKLGTATPRGDQNVWMEKFKERVEKRAPGRIEIRLYPSNQLGGIQRQIEGMQLGTQEGWLGPPSFLTGVEPRFQVIDAPGIFESTAQAHRALSESSFRDTYLALGESKGVKGIGIYCSNVMGVVSRKGPIRKLEDFKGLKIRVLGSAMETETLRRLGAAGVPMDLSEALPALQRGAIDGVRSGMVVFVPFKYWTLTKHLTRTAEAYIFAATFVSKRWFDSLPQDLRQIILEEARKQDADSFKYATEQDRQFQEIWTKNGGELIELPAAEKRKLMELVRPAGEAVVASHPAVKQTYDQLLAAIKSVGR